MEIVMKRLPYGISNFNKLIEENYIYIDKTKYIEILENLNEQYIVFLRPRRFGKSLFVSILEYYYDKEYKDLTIFDKLYIGKNPTKLKNSYFVLTFTFSGINTNSAETTISGFNSNVANGILRFLRSYNLEIAIDRSKSAAEMLDYFFSEVDKLLNEKIYILIDEYDHFANELLGFNEELFKTSVSQNGFVRKFYEVIKEGTRTGIVDRIFITGVTPITLDSMTSGFNIASNYTLEPMLNEMMGFTTEEIYTIADNTIKDKFDINNSIVNLKLYYDGYKFHFEGEHHLYNSDMILYYMSHLQRRGKEPEDMIDRNVVSDYGKIARLFEIGGREPQRIEILKEIVRGIPQQVRVKERFNLEQEFTIDDFKTLLFYMGMMTIQEVDEFGDTYISVPNYVMKELYFEYFEKIIEEETQYRIDEIKVSSAIKEIARDGKISQLVKLTEDTLKRLAGRDFIKFDEKYVKVIMLGFLFKSNLYFAKSEYEVEDGFIDIVLLKGTIGKPRYYAMLEVKYIKKKDYSEELVEEKLKEAKEQLEQYVKSQELMSIPNMKKFAVVFCGEKCVKIEDL